MQNELPPFDKQGADRTDLAAAKSGWSTTVRLALLLAVRRLSVGAGAVLTYEVLSKVPWP